MVTAKGAAAVLTALVLTAACGTTPEPTPAPTYEVVQEEPTPSSSSSKSAPTKAATKRVTPGAYCSTVGERGLSPKGVKMTCTQKAGENRPRWRRA